METINVRKTKWIITAMLLLSGIFVKAQPVMTVGPKAGVNFSKLTGVTDASWEPGLTAGFFMMYSEWEYFGISTDLLYSKKGSRYFVRPNEGSSSIQRVSLDYIEAPVLANFFLLGQESNIRPKIMVGPSFAYLIKAGQSGHNTTTIYTSDIGAVAGLGFNANIAEHTWFNFDARYTHGLFDIAGRNTNSDVKNQNISVTLGIGFGFGE